MVIKKDPTTGKYYIAPSPPSFYQSKPSNSGSSSGSSSSSGGSSGNAFIDLINDAKQQGDAKLAVIAPNYTPPQSPRGSSSSSSGGGSNSSGSSGMSQAQTTSQIQAIANQASYENQINAIDTGNRVSAALGVGTSNMATGLINQARNNAASNLQSVASVDPRVIAESGFKGRTTPETTMLAQQKVLRDQIKDAAERDINQYAKQVGEENKQAYQESLAFEERKLEEKFNDIQNRINNGGNYKKLSAEWESYKSRADKRLEDKATQLDKQATSKLQSYAKDWENTTGRNMANNAGLVLRSTDRLIRLSPKQLGKKFGGAFVKGAAVGGAATIAVQSSKTIGKFASKVSGAAVTGILAGVSLGAGYATAAYDVKKGRLSRDEFAVEGGARAVEGGVSFLGGFGGAVAGSLAVTGATNLIKTGNVRGIKPIERELATRAYERNGLAMRQVKGQVTEGTIRKSTFSQQGKNELIKEIKAGSVVRKTTYTPNTRGLSQAEIQALAKYRLKVEVYSVYNQQGQAIKTIEVARVTGKAPITKIIRGADETLSYGRGTITQKGTNIDRISFQQKGLGIRDRLTLTGQTDRLNQVSLEKVKGVGSVSKGDIFRLEAGVGKSTSIARFDTKSGILDLTPKTTTGEQLILSGKTKTSLLGITRGNMRVSQATTTYRDILGLGTSRSVSGTNPSSLMGLSKNPSSSSGVFSSGSTTSSGGTQLKSLNLLGAGSKSAPITALSSSTQQAAANIFSTTPTTQSTSIFVTPSLSNRSKTRELGLLQPNTQRVRTITRTKTSERVFSNRFFSGSAIGSSLGSGIVSAPAQRQSPLIRIAPPQQTSRPQQSLITPTTPTSNSLFKPAPLAAGGGFGFVPPFLGRVSVGGGGLNRATRGGIFGKTRYSPSLGSVLTGYSRKGNAKALSKQTFSGIGLRPLLTNTSKKKSKKKR